QELNEYPDDWKEAYLHLSHWVRRMQAYYGPRLRLRLLDPQSLVGLWRSLRYRIRRYPTFILEGQRRFVGWEAEPELHAALGDLYRQRGWALPEQPFRLMPVLGDHG
ncbi:hypothetical protein D6833_12040, partial [Candidatus Parcubacteria bacterium]